MDSNGLTDSEGLLERLRWFMASCSVLLGLGTIADLVVVIATNRVYPYAMLRFSYSGRSYCFL